MEKLRKEPAHDEEDGYDPEDELDPQDHGEVMVGDPFEEFVPAEELDPDSDGALANPRAAEQAQLMQEVKAEMAEMEGEEGDVLKKAMAAYEKAAGDRDLIINDLHEEMKDEGVNEEEEAVDALIEKAVEKQPHPATTPAEWRAQEDEQRHSLMVGNFRADQVAAMQQRADMLAGVVASSAKTPLGQDEDPLEAQRRLDAIRLVDKPVLPSDRFLPLLQTDPAAAAQLAASVIGSLPDNLQRCMAALEALLALPADQQPLVLEALEHAKLQLESLAPAQVPESQLRPGSQVNPADALQRALRLELRLLSDIDAARLEMRQRTPRERAREMKSLRKEAKTLGIDLNRLQLRDLDRVREAVQVVKFAHKYFPNDPLHNGLLNISGATPRPLDTISFVHLFLRLFELCL
jgi:hypothetical protein